MLCLLQHNNNCKLIPMENIKEWQFNENSSSNQIPQQNQNNVEAKYVPTKNRMKWNKDENIQYSRYLKQHISQFSAFKMRRQYKVFVKLATLIKTRNTGQVKSHHQKMMKRFRSVENIIKFIQSKYKEQEKVPLVDISKEEEKEKNEYDENEKPSIDLMGNLEEGYQYHEHYEQYSENYFIVYEGGFDLFESK